MGPGPLANPGGGRQVRCPRRIGRPLTRFCTAPEARPRCAAHPQRHIADTRMRGAPRPPDVPAWVAQLCDARRRLPRRCPTCRRPPVSYRADPAFRCPVLLPWTWRRASPRPSATTFALLCQVRRPKKRLRAPPILTPCFLKRHFPRARRYAARRVRSHGSVNGMRGLLVNPSAPSHPIHSIPRLCAPRATCEYLAHANYGAMRSGFCAGATSFVARVLPRAARSHETVFR